MTYRQGSSGFTCGLKALALALLMSLLALVMPQPAFAWDAGTESRVHTVGNGGENAIAIVDTRPKWAVSTDPSSSRVADCPAGYTNTGATCFRPADTISAPSTLATCPAGYENTLVSCFRPAHSFGAPSILATCPSGYTNTGVSCFRGASSYSAPSNPGTCPSGYTDVGLWCNWNSFPYIGTADHVCGAGYFLSGGLCRQNCQAGYSNSGETCDRAPSSLALSSASCPGGYFQGAVGRCNQTCPAGYSNTGETCFRVASTIDLANASCPAGYFNGALGQCNKICLPGYTNTGETCFRVADTLLTNSMSCLGNEEAQYILGVPRCYAKPICATGYNYFQLRCYVTPVATGEGGTIERTAISTVVHRVKQGGNTHLWIVNQALLLLEQSGLPGASAFVAQMNQANVRKAWEQGMWDGDAPAYVDYPGHQGTHFYNPAHKDRVGDNTAFETYSSLVPLSNSFDCKSARECARGQIKQIAGFSLDTSMTVDGKAQLAAYRLGLALHYMTDATSPMHSSGWSGLSIPINGHPHYEYYVPYVQGKFPATTWDQRWLTQTNDPDLIFLTTATRSNGYAPRLSNALYIGGGGGLVTLEPFNGIGVYTGFNFYNDEGVDALTGEILRDAYQSTASYLYGVSKTLFTNPIAKTCDVDANNIIDRTDINAIMVSRNQPANGPVDARDADGNGIIDANDARKCTLTCTNPRCALVPAPL